MKVCFEPWGEIPESSDLDKRLKSAGETKLTPVEFDPKEKTAVFYGSKVYHASLGFCDCPDYSISINKGKHLPCKHILRLAMMLGCIDYPYKEDASKVKDPAERIDAPLEHAVAAIELYPSLMESILHIMSGHSQREPRFFEDVSPYQFFIDNNLLVLSPSDNPNAGFLDTGENINGCFVKLMTYLSYRTSHYEPVFDFATGKEFDSPRDIGDLKSKDVKELLLKNDPFYRDHQNGNGISFVIRADLK